VKRQGKKLELIRHDREMKERIFLEAEQLSRACGERGTALVERCLRMANLSVNTDPAYVYRVLREAKRKRIGAQRSVRQEELPLNENPAPIPVPGSTRIKAVARKSSLTPHPKRVAR
jgi:hypothetical protein